MKQFLSIDEQLQYLVAEKNLTIGDFQYAKNMLTRIGYFGLISGYKGIFKNPVTNSFRDGICFEDIVRLYLFDENLRELFLRYLLRIERSLKTSLSYHFTEKYGTKQSQYLNAANFTHSKKHTKDVQRFIKTLDWLANRNIDYTHIKHHRRKYGNVPLWVLASAMPFGALAKFYRLTSPSVQAKVAKGIAGVNQKQYWQFLNVLTKYRNVCAHNERLVSYKTKNAIPDMPIQVKFGLSKVGTQYAVGKRDLFAVVIAFRYLLSQEDFKSFKSSLTRAIRTYLASTTAISEASLREMLGFPENWQKITRFKK